MTSTTTLDYTPTLQDAFKYEGVQLRSLLYLVPITTLPGRKTPIRLPEDDGKVERTAGYPRLPLLPAGSPVPTKSIGFVVLRNRRTVLETLTSLESNGLITSQSTPRVGHGKTWRATKRGKALAERALECFEAEGWDSPQDAVTFDKDGFDRFGINYFGFDKAGEYKGIHHVFQHYYGSSYYL